MSAMLQAAAGISYLEIGVSNPSKSRTFLEEMFGWKFHPFGQSAEGWFQTPSGKAGIHGNDPTRGFLVYFGVQNLEQAIADVNRLGGTAEAPSEEPGFGRFCICRDTQGLRFGLHQQ